MSESLDRNFDDLAERFARRVYGGLKGDIRLAVLWRDLQPVIAELSTARQRPLRILDVGGGLGQLAIRLAEQGHKVTFNDLSPVMLAAARARASELSVEQNMEWISAPYQVLPQQLQNNNQTVEFDLVLSHALLEWLEKPERFIPTIKPMLASDGYLSLCFYNPAAKIYRNLIRGNFNWLQQDSYISDQGSLTPNNPSTIEQVRQWLADANLSITSESGLRVFHDYVVDKRGGHQSAEQVLAMELAYSEQQPFKWLGRYLHVLARK
ncbi:methyltransferase domain-containing protein [Oceanicoccus sp. KOV_DT_Chl]|uniref:methyltransferase domain-containing protein n=1 Tax=Oceanicoccus sp. KOV_DT_Chl TaxID=1904639 RepID=UPI000C7D0D3A|nr:methyltransferase domain-containing protein [Oceanicoccus sp. KOV_DT_Chl]